jgi:hypothetical protein
LLAGGQCRRKPAVGPDLHQAGQTGNAGFGAVEAQDEAAGGGARLPAPDTDEHRPFGVDGDLAGHQLQIAPRPVAQAQSRVGVQLDRDALGHRHRAALPLRRPVVGTQLGEGRPQAKRRMRRHHRRAGRRGGKRPARQEGATAHRRPPRGRRRRQAARHLVGHTGRRHQAAQADGLGQRLGVDVAPRPPAQQFGGLVGRRLARAEAHDALTRLPPQGLELRMVF